MRTKFAIELGIAACVALAFARTSAAQTATVALEPCHADCRAEKLRRDRLQASVGAGIPLAGADAFDPLLVGRIEHHPWDRAAIGLTILSAMGVRPIGDGAFTTGFGAHVTAVPLRAPLEHNACRYVEGLARVTAMVAQRERRAAFGPAVAVSGGAALQLNADVSIEIELGALAVPPLPLAPLASVTLGFWSPRGYTGFCAPPA